MPCAFYAGRGGLISMKKKKKIDERNWNFLFAAWAISLIATLGALFIGEIMGKIPCNLCWYQRIFMFPLPIILGIALYRADFSVWRYGLPLSVGGAGIAAFHSLVFFKILPEEIKPCLETGPSCSGADMLLWGTLPLPLLSFIAFVSISISFIAIWKRS